MTYAVITNCLTALYAQRWLRADEQSFVYRIAHNLCATAGSLSWKVMCFQDLCTLTKIRTGGGAGVSNKSFYLYIPRRYLEAGHINISQNSTTTLLKA